MQAYNTCCSFANTINPLTDSFLIKSNFLERKHTNQRISLFLTEVIQYPISLKFLLSFFLYKGT